jgi:hypothetical protein
LTGEPFQEYEYISITRSQIKFCNACPARNCSFCPAATPLAVTIRERRAELGLTTTEAAALAGMPSIRWLALEMGAWIPADRSEMRAIADTLQANVSVVSTLALLSEYAA